MQREMDTHQRGGDTNQTKAHKKPQRGDVNPAQGNALGSRATTESRTPTGRRYRHDQSDRAAPLGLRGFDGLVTQGVALGWNRVAPSGREVADGN